MRAKLAVVSHSVFAVDHVHCGGEVRVLPGRTGVWIGHHLLSWLRPLRPLRVFWYLGAWRVVCRVCVTSVTDEGRAGHLTQEAAYAVARTHCARCPATATAASRAPVADDLKDLPKSGCT